MHDPALALVVHSSRLRAAQNCSPTVHTWKPPPRRLDGTMDDGPSDSEGPEGPSVHHNNPTRPHLAPAADPRLRTCTPRPASSCQP
jgi:hypothetical protein